MESVLQQIILSADGHYRVTSDDALSFLYLRTLHVDRADDGPDKIILELKYPPDADLGAQKITSAFPFHLTKFSKYAFGRGGDL